MKQTHILIVDDNPVNLKLAASVLDFAGYQVLEAHNAIQALAVVQAAHPDLILMDVGLPGMDGLTLTRQLKTDETTRRIPVVALTAFAMKGDDQKARAAGCDGYITKPIDTRKFPEQVAQILANAALNGEKVPVNILVIEDNPSHLKLAHHVLSAAGYNVNGAEAADQAIAAIKAERPNLILLDLELPGINGLALVRKLKADPETADIPVVAVTSYLDRFPRSEALAAGCAAYIAKPIDTRSLPRQLEQLMN